MLFAGLPESIAAEAAPTGSFPALTLFVGQPSVAMLAGLPESIAAEAAPTGSFPTFTLFVGAAFGRDAFRYDAIRASRLKAAPTEQEMNSTWGIEAGLRLGRD